MERLFALVAYEGPAVPLVLRLKAGRERSALGWCAAGLSLLFPPDLAIDVVTWAPTTRRRAASRGGDQGRMLATAVARRAGLRSHSTLVRLPGPAQHGRTRADRLAGPHLAARYALDGLAVAVVDDVTTTGATMAVAAGALVAAGARVVIGAAVAAALPVPRGPNRADPSD